MSLVSVLWTSLTNSLSSVFLAITFVTASLNLLKSTGVVSNIPVSNLSTV